MLTPADKFRRSGRPTPRASWRLAQVLIALMAWVVLPRQAMAANIVIVPSSNATPYQVVVDALTGELSRLGHVAHAVPLERLTDEQLAALEADQHTFIAIGTNAAVSLDQRLSERTLLVYCMVSEPEGQGLTRRTQTCGISAQVPMMVQFRLIAEALPKTRTVGMLYNGQTAESRALVQDVSVALPQGWRLETIDVTSYDTPAEAVQALFRSKPDIVWTGPDASVYNSATIRSLLLAALRKKTPVFGFSTPFVRAGALIGVGIDPRTQGLETATLTHDLISSGVPDLAFVRHQTPRFDIAVNLIVAEELNVEVSDSVVDRARYTFERSKDQTQ